MDLDVTHAQLPCGERGQAGRHLGHDPLARLDQHPAHPLCAAARIELDRLCGEVLKLGEPLEPRIAGADEDETKILGALGRIVERLGDVQAVQHLVAKRGGVGQRLEPNRVFRETGDRQRARDRSKRYEQVVIAKLDRLPVTPVHLDYPPSEIGAGDAPDDQRGAPQLRAQRNHHVARIERRPRNPGEQGRVEHEVGIVHQGHLGVGHGRDPLELTSGVEAAEAATDDDDARGHVLHTRTINPVEANVTSVLQAQGG